MSVIEQMATVREERRRAAETRADELARKDASGKKVDPVEALDTIAAAGLPDDWFAQRVAHYRTRAELLAKIGGQADLDARQRQCQKIMDGADTELKAAQERYTAAYSPAFQENQIVGQQIGECITARAQLQRTCKSLSIMDRLRQIGNELFQAQEQQKALAARHTYLTNELARLEPQLRDQEYRKAHPPMGRDVRTSYLPTDHNPREHARLQTTVENVQTVELPKVTAAIAALPGKVAALEAERAKLLVAAEQSPL